MTHHKSLIIGASASVGPNVVRSFLGHGASVMATHRGSVETQKFGTPSDQLKTVPFDLTERDDHQKLVKSVSEDFGKITSLVFLTGIISGKNLEAYDQTEAANIFDVNFTQQAFLLRALLPNIAQDARVLFVSSIAAERGSFDPFYAASKGAVIPFVKSIATAYGKHFSCGALLPGPIKDSTMFDEMDPAVQQKHEAQCPRGTLLSPDELSEIVWDVCQPHWRHMNGETIRLNGGSYV